jgi:hypothetical protein
VGLRHVHLPDAPPIHEQLARSGEVPRVHELELDVVLAFGERRRLENVVNAVEEIVIIV